MNIFWFLNRNKIKPPEIVEKERDFEMYFKVVIQGKDKQTETGEMRIVIKAKNLESAKSKLKEWVNQNAKVYLGSYDDRNKKGQKKPFPIPIFVRDFI